MRDAIGNLFVSIEDDDGSFSDIGLGLFLALNRTISEYEDNDPRINSNWKY